MTDHIMYREEKLAGSNITVGRSRITSGKFRKKPVVIEANQFLEGEPIPKGVCFGWRCGDTSMVPHLHTIHNEQRVDLAFGDWIIPEPDGIHFYPCKPDIFEATYEPV